MHLPSTEFKIYGIGLLEKELIEYSKKLKIEDIVYFMGHCDNVTAAYHDSDLILFLSERESFGNVVVESILCGTPVIASAIPSMKEIFGDYPEFLIELDDNLKENILLKIRNIEHLKMGTMKDNVADMISKKRHPYIGTEKCVNGHLRIENMRKRKDGTGEYCGACKRITALKRYHKLKEVQHA